MFKFSKWTADCVWIAFDRITQKYRINVNYYVYERYCDKYTSPLIILSIDININSPLTWHQAINYLVGGSTLNTLAQIDMASMWNINMEKIVRSKHRISEHNFG